MKVIDSINIPVEDLDPYIEFNWVRREFIMGETDSQGLPTIDSVEFKVPKEKKGKE